MAGKYRKFSPEFREEAARMVVETSRAIADVARELGINETSLGNWVRAYREQHAEHEQSHDQLPTSGSLCQTGQTFSRRFLIVKTRVASKPRVCPAPPMIDRRSLMS